MNNWYKFGDFICSSLKGITPKYVGKSNVIVLNQRCIRDNKIDYSLARYHDGNKKFSDAKILRKGDLLFNSTGQGTAGRCVFVRDLPNDKIVITDSHILIVRIDDYYLSECFSYMMYKEENLLQTYMDGSTGQGELDKLRVFNLEFRLPESKFRKPICQFLNYIDTKIELNNKINQELEAMTKLLYDYWFVQFDFPDANGKPYKASGGKMVYNEELKREIPEKWEIKTIGDYCKSTGGYAFKSTWWSETGSPVVKIKDIQEDNTINISTISYADLSDINIDNKFICKPGDVLIAMTGATVGKYAIVPYTDEALYVNQRVGYFNLGNEPTEKLAFLINSLNQKYFRETVFTLASGAAQPNISNEQINNIKLLLPTKELVKTYNHKMRPFYDEILNYQRQNQKLAELRDWLLPMLMNGQVTVDTKSYTQNKDGLGMVAEEELKYGEK